MVDLNKSRTEFSLYRNVGRAPTVLPPIATLADNNYTNFSANITAVPSAENMPSGNIMKLMTLHSEN